jgi:hypothetical protein
MSKAALLLRRQLLLLRSSELRSELSGQAEAFKRPLALADKAQRGLIWLYRHPVLPVALLVVLLALRPRRVLVWGARMWPVWGALQRMRSWLA